jgi:hypothetical protein
MQHIRAAVLATLTLLAAPAFAETHTVVGFLSMQKGRLMRLFVNQESQGRFTLNVLNPKRVASWLKRHNYSGLVRVQMSVKDQVGEQASVEILKIEPVRARRVPQYNNAWAAVPNGKG